MTASPSHLDLLEAESIHIFREAAAQFRKPVMLYSIGKDSTVLLHLARKAFFPQNVPFPLMHIDTTWKFRDMIAFRDRTAKRARSRPDRPHQRGRHQARHQSDRSCAVDPHRRFENAGFEASARQVCVRRCVRRRTPR